MISIYGFQLGVVAGSAINDIGGVVVMCGDAVLLMMMMMMNGSSGFSGFLVLGSICVDDDEWLNGVGGGVDDEGWW
ncbi:hypothetical protein QYF36_027061 [Acer negundo]|nr:hypothetical protein QYF36_027061 [Acer negundo]